MYQEKIYVTSNDVDSYLDTKLGAIFRYLQQVSTNHAELIGLGKKDTVDKGMFWVITRMKVVIHCMPKMHETINVCTHPGDMIMFLFPRFYQIYSESGELLVEASAVWVLLDSITHKAKMKPFGDNFTFKGEKDEKDLPLPEKVEIAETSLLESRKVRYSDTDLNGHLNNTKYIDYIVDAHDSNFYKKYKFKEICINYEKEINDNQIVNLYSSNSVPETIVGDVDDVHSFIAKVNYQER